MTLPVPRTRRCTMPQCGTLNWNAPDVPIAPGPSFTIGPVTPGVVAGGGVAVTFAGTRPRREASSSERSFAGTVTAIPSPEGCTNRPFRDAPDINSGTAPHHHKCELNRSGHTEGTSTYSPRFRRRAPEAFRVRRGAEASLLADGAVR